MADRDTPAEAAKLEKLKEALADVESPNMKDYILLRFLRARNQDVKLAEAMFRESLAWRREMQVDTILEDFKLSKLYQNYFPGGIHKEAKDGSPIIISQEGHIDAAGFIAALGTEEILKSHAYESEAFWRGLQTRSEQEGRLHPGVTLIVDLDGLGMKHLAREFVNLYNQLSRIDEDNYPETLVRALIVRAPGVFPMAWGVVKGFLDEGTRIKVQVCGSDYLSTLREFIDNDNIPAFLGGGCRCEGDDLCRSTVTPGGAIPEELVAEYRARRLMNGLTIPQDGAKPTSWLNRDIAAKAAFSFPVRLGAAQCVHWEFVGNSSDLAFSLTFRAEEGEQGAAAAAAGAGGKPAAHGSAVVVPPNQIKKGAGQHAAEGVAGVATLVWDNAASYMRSKSVKYRVWVTGEPPADDDDDDDAAEGKAEEVEGVAEAAAAAAAAGDAPADVAESKAEPEEGSEAEAATSAADISLEAAD